MKEHHKVEVIRITEVRPHPNADRLEIIPIQGYQAIAAKGQFKAGDLAYYVPPDSIVPQRPEFEFLWNGPVEGEVPIRKRRIAAKKLRGEWSEGLLMSLTVDDAGTPMERWGIIRMDAPLTNPDGTTNYNAHGKMALCLKEGDDLADFWGITHYDPEAEGEGTPPGGNEGNPKKWRYPRTIRGWVSLIKAWLNGERREGGISLPVYDVEAYKKHTNAFVPGENVVVTEKIHGSNARYTYRTGLLGGKFYVGSRFLWKAPGSTCKWRKAVADNPWIETWCRQHPGYSLYGEITPTQKGFDYGSGDKVRFFVFDVRKPDGVWASRDEVDELFNAPGIELWYNEVSVPMLYAGPFDLTKILKLVDGPSTVKGAKHIREGIVIKTRPERTVHHLGRAQLKIVSNEFLLKDTKEAA